METTTKHNSLIGFTSILGRFKGIFVLLLMLLSTLTAGAQEIEYYDIWLGDTQVTSANKDNILGQLDANNNPTAKYVPDAELNVLFLNEPTITGTHNNSKIYSGLDETLAIAGSYHMSEKETDYGIYAVEELYFAGNEDENGKDIIGDFTFYGNKCGVYCGGRYLNVIACFLKAVGGDYGVHATKFEFLAYTLDSEGGKQAIDGIVAYFGQTIIAMPEGGSQKNHQIYEADGTTIAKHVILEYPYKYNLWLGSTRVHSLNKDNILNQLNDKGQPTASYDPETQTLTLNDPTIPGSCTENYTTSKIYADRMDLTIKGSYHMTEAETANGIYMDDWGNKYSPLTLDGEFTFIGAFRGIKSRSDITLKSGSLTAVGIDGGGGFGINSLTVEDGVDYIDLQGGSYALDLYYGGGLHLAEEYAITTPENGIFQNNVIYHSDGTTIAKNAVIQNTTNPIQFYDLWVGVKHVNDRNQDDIFGDGKASFDPTTNTLTLNNPTIAGTINHSKIYSKLTSLTITGSYHMTEAETRSGIYSEGGPLTLNGDFTILSKGDWLTGANGVSLLKAGNILWATGDITLNGNITIQGQDVKKAAIYTESGNITVLGGNLQASSNNKCGAYCGGTFTAKGSAESITLEGTNGAIHAGNLVIDNAEGQQLGCYEPENAFFSTTWKSVYRREGNMGFLATRVVLSQPKVYNLWLGSTKVTEDNCDDILGDGKARFNPLTNTLTLNNPAISGTTNDCAIYGEWMDLTVKGSATVNTTASCAIKLMYGELTLDGDFTFEGNDYAIWFNRTMKLGQTTEITSPENVDFMGGNTVVLKSDYSTVAKSVTMRNVDGYKIWLGSTQVTSINKDNILGDGRASYNPDTQTLTLNEPTINGTYSVGKIFAINTDLTISGSYHMNSAEESVGLYVSNCTLTIIGDFTFRGSLWGVESDKSINVRGNLKAIGSSTGIHFDNENCVLTLEHGMMTTRVEMNGGEYAMSGGSVATGATLLVPEGGRVNRLGYIRTVNDEIATEAVLEYRYANHGDGTEASPYRINSKEDWNLLAEDIEKGASTRGIYFALVADIKVSKMLGTEQNPFSGTFNGYGCTLTADINENMQGVAPFRAISGATIRNLKVAGMVIGYSNNAGIVGYVKGNGNLIKDCEVSASIGAFRGNNGGIVGHAGSYTTTLDGCVFRGSFFGTNASSILYNGTFVGWDETGAQLTLTRCLDLSKSDPIGRGLVEPISATYIYSTFDKSQESGPNRWTTVPQLAYKVTGSDVNLTLTGSTGATWNGYLYAAQDETLSFTVNRPGVAFTSTAGTFTQDYEECTLVMPGEDVTILNANASSFDIALAPYEHGTAVVKNASRAGAVVGIHITPATYYLLDEVTVKDDDNNEYEVEIDGEYGFFTMPNSDVTVTVTFKKQYSFENGVLHLKYGDFNIINHLGFDTDVMEHRGEVLKVIADEGVRFTQSCSQLFKDFTGCTEMDLSNVNTAGLVTTSEMFSGCTNLQKLNMTGWETYQINYMNSMFEGCSSLREIDLSGFHVSEGTSMTRMFGTTGICKLTLPAGMAVTKEMELNKGRTYHNTYEGTWSNGTWSYSGWTVLGANGEVVSTVGDVIDSNNNTHYYAEIPTPPVAMTFVWKDMPDDFTLELPDGEDNSRTIADWNGIKTSVQLTGRKLYKDGDWNTICLPFMALTSEIQGAFGTTDEPEIIRLSTDYYALHEENGESTYMCSYAPIRDEENGFIYCTGFDETTGTLSLFFEPSSYEIMPGTPYLIKWDNTSGIIESPTFSNVTIDISSDDANVSKTVTSEDGTVTFTGTYDPIAFTSENRSVLFLGTNNNLYYPDGTATTTINAFRAYFQLNGITAGDPSNPSSSVKAFVLNFGDDTETGIIAIDNGQWTMDNEADAIYNLAGQRLSKMQRGINIVNGKKVLYK